MAGYKHTCAVCDAQLKIHERYVGRTLHCTECGTEFLADPTLADIDDTIAEDRRSFPWLWAIVAVFVLAVAALWLGQAHQGGFFADLFKPNRTAGQIAVLELEGRDKVALALDSETVVFIIDALEDPDPGTFEALRAQGRMIEVVAGTRVKVIERVRRDRSARVRILTGVWTGRVVWAPAMALK
jgi:hypothetical protein